MNTFRCESLTLVRTNEHVSMPKTLGVEARPATVTPNLSVLSKRVTFQFETEFPTWRDHFCQIRANDARNPWVGRRLRYPMPTPAPTPVDCNFWQMMNGPCRQPFIWIKLRHQIRQITLNCQSVSFGEHNLELQ